MSDFEQAIINRETVQCLLAFLKPRQREVIELRYGLNGNGAHTLRQIGDIVGTTPENVRHHQLKALRIMRFKARAAPHPDSFEAWVHERRAIRPYVPQPREPDPYFPDLEPPDDTIIANAIAALDRELARMRIEQGYAAP